MKQKNKLSVLACKVEFIYKSESPGALVFCHRYICQVGKFFLLSSSFIEQTHIFFLFWFVDSSVVNCFPQ